MFVSSIGTGKITLFYLRFSQIVASLEFYVTDGIENRSHSKWCVHLLHRQNFRGNMWHLVDSYDYVILIIDRANILIDTRNLIH